MMMNTFYKVAWQVMFVIFYPFITLFSLLFIGMLSIVSAISGLFTRSETAGEAEDAEAAKLNWEPFMQHHGLYLSRKAVHEVQFGPVLYQIRSNPSLPYLQQAYWSDFIVPIGEGFLLQRWPSIAEHELERFELVYVRPGLQEPYVLQVMPTFYWQSHEHTHECVEISWNEQQERKSLIIDEEQLP